MTLVVVAHSGPSGHSRQINDHNHPQTPLTTPHTHGGGVYDGGGGDGVGGRGVGGGRGNVGGVANAALAAHCGPEQSRT